MGRLWTSAGKSVTQVVLFLERCEMKMKSGRPNQWNQIELFVIGVNEMLI